MSNARKILNKMRQNHQNWRIEHFETVASQYKILVRKGGGGSHVIFDHPKWVELLSVPAKRPIKPIYVKKFLALIDILENTNDS